MRKLLLLVTSICYFACSTGVAMQWHYCMGKLRGIGLAISPTSVTCGKCGMEKGSNDCCKDEVSITKITDSHQQSSSFAGYFISSIALPASFYSWSASSVLPAKASYPVLHDPPGFAKDRGVLHCVFRC